MAGNNITQSVQVKDIDGGLKEPVISGDALRKVLESTVTHPPRTSLAPDTPTTRYYNLLDLPIHHPHPGQLLIRNTIGNPSTTKTIIYSR